MSYWPDRACPGCVSGAGGAAARLRAQPLPRRDPSPLLAVDRAGLPAAVLVNCAVRDVAGRLLGVADLLDREAGLMGEHDSAEHRGDLRSSRDAVKDRRTSVR